ncbi:hypothetical protein ACVI1K_003365 [Bradyrhizobium sp. USDA 4508]
MISSDVRMTQTRRAVRKREASTEGFDAKNHIFLLPDWFVTADSDPR